MGLLRGGIRRTEVMAQTPEAIAAMRELRSMMVGLLQQSRIQDSLRHRLLGVLARIIDKSVPITLRVVAMNWPSRKLNIRNDQTA